jgi:hypothetical protein
VLLGSGVVAAGENRASANACSFYYCFKTKEELLLAVLELYIQTLMPVVIQPALAISLWRFRRNSSAFTNVWPTTSMVGLPP